MPKRKRNCTMREEYGREVKRARVLEDVGDRLKKQCGALVINNVLSRLKFLEGRVHELESKLNGRNYEDHQIDSENFDAVKHMYA